MYSKLLLSALVASATASCKVYTVGPGDMGSSVAAAHGISLDELASMNPDASLWHGLVPGTSLCVGIAEDIKQRRVVDLEKRIVLPFADEAAQAQQTTAGQQSDNIVNGEDTKALASDSTVTIPDAAEAPAPTTANTSNATQSIISDAEPLDAAFSDTGVPYLNETEPSLNDTFTYVPGLGASGLAGGLNETVQLYTYDTDAYVYQWNGLQHGIGSWYRTTSSRDSTNGHSWCGYPYNDDTPGFAPDVSKMMGDFGWNYNKAAKAYCGLEARVVGPDGTVRYLYIADGFDSRYVLSYGSIDIIFNAFRDLRGYWTSDKNNVLKPVRWEFTGRRSSRYAFKGYGH